MEYHSKKSQQADITAYWKHLSTTDGMRVGNITFFTIFFAVFDKSLATCRR